MTEWRSGIPINILLVEDNPGDVRLTIESLKQAKVHNQLSVAEDGVKALAYLRREEPYADAPRPDLVLLDLNLPKKDGREVLEEIKDDPDLSRIPVVVLTTSRSEEDIFQAFEMRVRSYITKPVDFKQFMEVVQGIDDFWLSIVKRPAE